MTMNRNIHIEFDILYNRLQWYNGILLSRWGMGSGVAKDLPSSSYYFFVWIDFIHWDRGISETLFFLPRPLQFTVSSYHM